MMKLSQTASRVLNVQLAPRALIACAQSSPNKQIGLCDLRDSGTSA
jgi:hypothetical protein